jgi:pilin isopeptide linkage protein
VENYNAAYEVERSSSFAVASVQIYARKTVRGTSRRHEGEFNFGLFNVLGELKQKAQNRNGGVVFNVNFIFQGVYKYWIREIPVRGGNFLFDKRVYPVEVIVEKDYWGSLRARVMYPKGLPVFENTYRRNY